MTTAAYAAIPRNTHWGVVSVVVGSGIVTAMQVGKAAIATPLLQTDLGLDLAAAGWLTGIFAVLGLVGGIPAGTFVARVGDRRMLILGLGVIALGTVIGATALGVPVLLASRALEGFGFLLVTVAGPAILHRVVQPGQRDLAFALWSCFMPAGMALAMLAGPLFSDWRTLWWGNAGLAAAAIVAGLAIVPAAPARVSVSWRSAASDALQVLTSREPVLLAVCFGSYSLMFFALFSFLPVLLMEQMEIAHGTAGLLSSVATGANIIGNLAAGYLLARGTSRFALLSGAYLIMGLTGIGIFLQVFGGTPTLTLCILFSGVGGLIPATLISSAPLVAPSAALAPVVIGLVMQGSNLGQVIGPVTIGGAIASYGWKAAAGIILISGLIATIAVLVVSFSDELPP
ncbi:MFS transporter [Microvirga sp. BSC39]|uniref:MFS transporter n=1 Tax=Microvirga sp. BSC39 TaxID=1549810 RepID=UPI0004E88568|nr:MFS transporter [Microvirga sp. BSC39]KFG67880.1 MFS transporter [Microvirga sp. BSC39]